MGRILLRHQWTQQPPASQPLDYGNPLLKGLWALYHAPRGLGNAYASPASQWSMVAGSYGLSTAASGFASSKAGYFKTSFSKDPAGAWTMFALVRPPQPLVSSQFIMGFGSSDSILIGTYQSGGNFVLAGTFVGNA